MQTNDDEKTSFCRRVFRFVVVKLMSGPKEDKTVKKRLMKKESKSDVTIYFKQREDSEDSSRSEKERVIMLVNGSTGPKKMVHEKGKNMVSEGGFIRPDGDKIGDGKSYGNKNLSDINKKSDAFIQSRLERMRKSL